MTTFLSKIKASDAGEEVFQVELKKTITKMATTEYDGVVYIKAKTKEEANAKIKKFITGESDALQQGIFSDEECKEEATDVDYLDWEKNLHSGYDDDEGKAEFDISGIYPMKD